ncbi:MAG: hypothetical protein GEV08_21185 [Acidimicrobiia bacterium]|nr:hypothetical protein [Acidimicrobiia bacterium]
MDDGPAEGLEVEVPEPIGLERLAAAVHLPAIDLERQEEPGPGEVHLVAADPMVEASLPHPGSGQPPSRLGLRAAVGTLGAKRPTIEHLAQRTHASPTSGSVALQRPARRNDRDHAPNDELVERGLDVRLRT